jgi:putative membrane protein insertion efficiency factor
MRFRLARSTRSVVLFPIRLYQKVVSPLFPPVCRFMPTCSHYAIEAIEVHGVVRGLILASHRIMRCHPWHAGGWDPVPARRDRTQ